jgi:hypothetical protein
MLKVQRELAPAGKGNYTANLTRRKSPNSITVSLQILSTKKSRGNAYPLWQGLNNVTKLVIKKKGN